MFLPSELSFTRDPGSVGVTKSIGDGFPADKIQLVHHRSADDLVGTFGGDAN
jgi:hypothetical protein